MEVDLINSKTEIANDFWRDKFIQIGKDIAPRKKYKQLKVLSLTNSRNTEDVNILKKEHLSSRDNMFAWCNDYIEASSLEADSKFNEVLDAADFGEALINCTDHKVDSYFPFHILNIDFTSQAIESGAGRLEKELHSIERVLMKQKEKNRNSGWLILVTTLIDNSNVDTSIIKTNSDQYIIDSWSGITLSKRSTLNTPDDIKSIIIEFFQQLKLKYELQDDINSFTKPINSHEIMSVSVLVKKQG
jgi:hypothetical protein